MERQKLEHFGLRLHGGGRRAGRHRGGPFFRFALTVGADVRIDAPPGLFEFLVDGFGRSEEHTSELQSLMRISYAVFCLKKKTQSTTVRTILIYTCNINY